MVQINYQYADKAPTLKMNDAVIILAIWAADAVYCTEVTKIGLKQSENRRKRTFVYGGEMEKTQLHGGFYMYASERRRFCDFADGMRINNKKTLLKSA